MILHSAAAEGLCSTPLGTTNISPTLRCTAPASKLDGHLAIKHNKHFIRVCVAVPDKLALNLDELELIVIHLCDDFRCPVVRKFGLAIAKTAYASKQLILASPSGKVISTC